jgi:hypothetical protein
VSWSEAIRTRMLMAATAPRSGVESVVCVKSEVFGLVMGAMRGPFTFNTVELSVGFRGHSLSPSTRGSVSVSTLSTLSTGM